MSVPTGVTSGESAWPPAGFGASCHAQVMELTERLFGLPPAMADEIDPETGETYFVIFAAASGRLEEILAKNDRWHRELNHLAGSNACHYRLVIDPQ